MKKNVEIWQLCAKAILQRTLQGGRRNEKGKESLREYHYWSDRLRFCDVPRRKYEDMGKVQATRCTTLYIWLEARCHMISH